MAIIKSGPTSDELIVDPTSKAARTSPYDPSGNALSADNALFSAGFQIRFTGATSADSAVFILRNGASKALIIKKLIIVTAFDGTAALTLSRYQLVRFSGSTASSGGTALTAAPQRAAFATTITDARFETAGSALTNTTASYEAGSLAQWGVNRTPTGQSVMPDLKLDDPLRHNDHIGEIAAGTGNGVAIRNVNTAVVGDSLTGTIWWEER